MTLIPKDSRAVWKEVVLDKIDGASRCRTAEVFHVCPDRLTGSEVVPGLQSSAWSGHRNRNLVVHVNAQNLTHDLQKLFLLAVIQPLRLVVEKDKVFFVSVVGQVLEETPDGILML